MKKIISHRPTKKAYPVKRTTTGGTGAKRVGEHATSGAASKKRK